MRDNFTAGRVCEVELLRVDNFFGKSVLVVVRYGCSQMKGDTMATRGIVARATNEGWEGRYTHWDNYPQRMIYALGEIVARDGVDKAIQTLITDTPSWSQIEPLAKSGVPNLYEQHALVEGYGYAHTDTTLEESDLFTHTDTELAWAEWLYIIHETMLEVRRIDKDENGNDIAIPHTSFTWESIAIKEVTA